MLITYNFYTYEIKPWNVILYLIFLYYVHLVFFKWFKYFILNYDLFNY